MPVIDEKKLQYIEFLNREQEFQHHKYSEEMLQYELMKAGDMRAVAESVKVWQRNFTGKVSDDPVRNIKYLFVASITLVTRFAIEGGMESERAYNTSDLYIREVDKLNSVAEVLSLHKDMFTFFTQQMQSLNTEKISNKKIALCVEYIHFHLYQKITVKQLSDYVKLSENYLSSLFKKETGKNISDYITGRRIDAAKNMLKYSDFDFAKIAFILAFSSQSHFTKVFREQTKYTPAEYRKKFFKTAL